MSARTTEKRFGSAALPVVLGIIAGLLISAAVVLNAQSKDEKIETEIIKTSRIPSQWPEFKINRDIFSPDTMRPRMNRPLPPPPTPQMIKQKEEEEKKIKEQQEIVQDLERELRQTLFYEGYVIRSSPLHQNYALVSLNGEFSAVGPGDIVGDKITIVSITKELIKVKVENKIFEIQLKGDNEDEN